MPWRLRPDVGLSLVALLLTASVVVSCVSVTTTAVTPATPTPERSVAALQGQPSDRPAHADDVLGTPSPSPTPPADGTSRPIREAQVAATVPSATPVTLFEATPPAVATHELASSPALSAAASPPAALALPAATMSAGPAVTDASPVTARTTTSEPAPTSAVAVATGASPSPEASVASDASATPRPRNGVLDRATVRRIQRILARTTGRKRVAGLQVAIRLADGETWVGASGSAEFAPRRPVRDDTVFAIASVTKTFIAALILQLAEEGRLDLDAPYGRYLPVGPRRKKVTIRQLLGHRSGIYDFFANPRYIDISGDWAKARPQAGLSSREHEWTFEEIMGLVRPVSYCRPGACYRYSNTNYVLLGRVAEVVGEAPLDRLLRQRFFRPLGLDDTYYQPADVPPASAAHGHWDTGTGYADHTRDAGIRPFMAAASVAGAAGAIASTARDLSVWADALYGGTVLRPASLAQMTATDPDSGYGLGTFAGVFAGHRAYGHRGGLRGFESSMWYFPDERVSIVLLSNQGNWFLTRGRSIDEPMKAIVKALLNKGR